MRSFLIRSLIKWVGYALIIAAFYIAIAYDQDWIIQDMRYLLVAGITGFFLFIGWALYRTWQATIGK
jgi:hypothetical protein